MVTNQPLSIGKREENRAPVTLEWKGAPVWLAPICMLTPLDSDTLNGVVVLEIELGVKVEKRDDKFEA